MPQFFDIIGACGKAGNGDSAAGICSVRAGNEAGAGGVGIDPKLPSGSVLTIFRGFRQAQIANRLTF